MQKMSVGTSDPTIGQNISKINDLLEKNPMSILPKKEGMWTCRFPTLARDILMGIPYCRHQSREIVSSRFSLVLGTDDETVSSAPTVPAAGFREAR
jgi:hypothetical protein